MRRTLILAAALAAIAVPASAAQRLSADLGPAEFYRPPQLTVMVGFIKDPQHQNFTLEEWARGIGKNFDARSLAERFRKAGVTQVIWYDKWIDGLVFRKTKTTGFVTWRDFLADLSRECKRTGIRLVIYFNTFYDGNPEFAQWACLDQRGKAIPFSDSWPLNLLSMYSPFREKALEQIRELLVDYGVDGIWLDVPNYPSVSYDNWSRQAFQRKYGKLMEESTPAERREFAIESTVNWNREVAAFVRKIKPAAVVTTNGHHNPLTSGPRDAAGMAEPIDYFSNELHTSQIQQRSAPVLGMLAKPAEAGTLISDDWFTPLNSGPLKSSKSSNQVQLELATLFGNGLNVYLAIALAHDGTAHESTLQLVDLAGDWLRARRAYLEKTEPFCDVGIVLGTPDPRAMEWPGGRGEYNTEITQLEEHLRQSGYPPCRFLNLPGFQTWPEWPSSLRAVIVPDRVSLTPEDSGKLSQFARNGGRVLAFARGAGLGISSDAARIDPLFGVRGYGYLEPGSRGGLSLQWQGKSLAVSPPLIHVQVGEKQAPVWVRTGVEGEMPALTRQEAGKGRAYFSTIPESSLLKVKDYLGYVWTEAFGEPLWKTDDTTGRYFIALRQQGSRKVLHVMDSLSTSEGPMQRYRPAYHKLYLNSQVVPFRKATVVPDQRALEVSQEGTWSVFTVYPDPELTIVLE